jgi:signal transduction histidine kinase
MKANEGSWPYRPTHITNDGEMCSNLDARSLGGTGIISNEHLRGILTDICADLNQPASFLEFPPEPSRQPVYTDSRLFSSTSQRYGLCSPCAIAQSGGVNTCAICDECQRIRAGLFRGLTKSGIDEQLGERIKSNAYFTERREKDTVPYVAQKWNSNRCYVEYDCPFAGYREVVLPVFFEQQVIGVLLIRQICVCGSEHVIAARQGNLILQYKQCLAQSRHVNSSYEGESAIRGPVAAPPEYLIDNPDAILSVPAYEQLIRRACQKLDALEETLDEQMLLQRERYVRERIDQYTREFRSQLPNRLDRENSLDFLWANVRDRMSGFIHDFSIAYVIVFGPARLTQENSNLLDVVSYAVHAKARPSWDLYGSIEKGSLKFDLGYLPPPIRRERTTSARHPEVFTGLRTSPIAPTQETHLVRLFPVPFLDTGSVVILMGFFPENPATSVENSCGGPLDRYSEQFYGMVLATLSSIRADMATTTLRRSLQILGHETAQLNFGLGAMIRRYLSDADLLRRLSREKAADICRDIQGYFGQLDLLFKQARMVVSQNEAPPKWDEFWPFGELLYKWKDFYHQEVQLKDLSFDIPVVQKTDPWRPRLYGDRTLLEQLLYNLVTNAVKYCYPGTTIRIDCKKADLSTRSPHILTVTDYGREFRCRSPFQIFSRGDNVTDIEGMGIGLYTAKRIADMHHASFDWCTELVSEYNVPLIEPYINEDFKKDVVQEEKLKAERDRLTRSGKYCQIIAQDRPGSPLFQPVVDEIVDMIGKPTWEVTFRVILPAKGTQS